MENRAKWMCCASMVIYGTIGLVRTGMTVTSGRIACARGWIGAAFLLIFLLLCGKKINLQTIRRNLFGLALSGALMGANWILLFEAYNYTSIATATLGYYMAPVFVLLASPFVLRERLTGRKIACIFAALLGMVFVSGVLGGGALDLRGIALAVGAAVLYACVILINEGMIREIDTYDKTITQLLAAAVVLTPYALLERGETVWNAEMIGLLLLLGIVHTGVAYALYFGSMQHLDGQTVALYSYLDPVVAVLLSAVQKPLTLFEIVGACLVLGATFVNELPVRKKI